MGASITIKGRVIPLLYTTLEMRDIQRDIAPIGKAIPLVLGRNAENEKDTSRYASAEHLDAVAKMIRILGNAGLEEAGESPDLTEKKILRGLKPMEIAEAINACMTAINEGLASEIPDKAKDGPVDVTLEEMKKKETPGG